MIEERKIRARIEERQKASHINEDGGISYDIDDPILKLRIAASSCFFGEPQFYHSDPNDPRPLRKSLGRSIESIRQDQKDYVSNTLLSIVPQDWNGETPAVIMEKAIDAALDHDPEATLKEAVRLRSELFMRTTPIVILVRAANHPKLKGTGLVRKYAKEIIARADEIPNSLAYHLTTYATSRTNGKRPIPMSLLRSYDDAFNRFSATQLAKYRMEDREVTLVDAANLTYGLKKAWARHSEELANPKIPEGVKKLISNDLKVTGKTWEAIRSEEGASKESWEKSVPKMGHMSLLRNIRGMLQDKVEPDLFLPKLIETAADGKQMPFRYLTAFSEVQKIGAPSKVLDAIEECLELSIGNLPKFEGRTVSLSDNSGSALTAFTSSMGSMPIAQIGNLMGVLTGKASDDGLVGVFGDRLEMFNIRKKSSLFDQVEKMNRMGQRVGEGTEHGIWLFFDGAISKKEHYDTIFVYSDMQAGHGGLYGTDPDIYEGFRWMGGNCIDVPLLIDTYRDNVNPDVDIFLVQIAGGVDTVVPEWYHRTYILGGWSPEILRFADEMKRIVR